MKRRRFPRTAFVLPFVALLAAGVAWAAPAPARIPVFLSTDVGCEIDDQWVLLHLLTDPRIDLRTIASAHAPADGVPAPAAETTAATARQLVRRLGLDKSVAVVTGSNVALADERTPRDSQAVAALLRAARPYGPRNRLTVLVTGAATDVASSLLTDPALADRIRIVAMGFRSYASGDEYNIQNDPSAWRVILASRVPLAIGDGTVTARRLSLTPDEAKARLRDLGQVGAWLQRDYDKWYETVTRTFDNPERPEAPHSWPIWDEVVVAHVLGLTRSDVRRRPTLGADLTLVPNGRGTVTWITDIERDAVFGAWQGSIAAFAKGKRFADDDCVMIAREPNACWRAAAK
jgi:purine nucleosidase